MSKHHAPNWDIVHLYSASTVLCPLPFNSLNIRVRARIFLLLLGMKIDSTTSSIGSNNNKKKHTQRKSKKTGARRGRATFERCRMTNLQFPFVHASEWMHVVNTKSNVHDDDGEDTSKQAHSLCLITNLPLPHQQPPPPQLPRMAIQLSVDS